MKRIMKRMVLATIVIACALLSLSTLAALPTKFRWDNVDGKCYTTPVKTQKGTEDQSYAYAPMDFIESVNLILKKKPYDGLTDTERAACTYTEAQISAFAAQAKSAPDAPAAEYYQRNTQLPFIGKSYDWILRSWLDGSHIIHMYLMEGIEQSSTGTVEWKASLKYLKQNLVNAPLLTWYQHVDSFFNNGKYCYFPMQPDSSSYYKREYYRTAMVVGFDDSISASFFKTGGKVPEGDGAWIVKGSYGTGFGDNGYFYVSYYDDNIFRYRPPVNHASYMGLAWTDLCFADYTSVLIPDVQNKYGRLYCHRAENPTSLIGVSMNELDSCAVVFTAESDDTINAIGIMGAHLDDYKIYAFVGCTEDSPATGTCVIDGKEMEFPDRTGYFTIDLPTPFAVKKGQRYSIIVDCAESVAIMSNPNPVKGRFFRSHWNIDGIDAMQWTDMANSTVDNEWFITAYAAPNDDDPTPGNPKPDDPTPDDPTPDDPTPDDPAPDDPTPDDPTPDDPTPDDPMPGKPEPPPCPVCVVMFHGSTNSLPAKTIGTYVVDSCCGEAVEHSLELTVGEPFGELPIPLRRAGYKFDGWYTGEDGAGMKATPDAIVPGGDFVLYQHWVEIRYAVNFESQSVVCEEGSNISIVVTGGIDDSTSSATIFIAYDTAVAADVDMAKGAIDGVTPKGGLKFPLTLSWSKGEVGEKRISIPVKADTTIEGMEMLTLQLGNAKGVELGDVRVCTVEIRDMNSDITLAQGLGNESLKPSMSGTGKWTAHEAAHCDPSNGCSVFVQSPDLKAGQVAKLDLGTFNGSGRLLFELEYVGNDYAGSVSTFGLYDNSKRYGPITQTENGEGWHGWQVVLSSSGAHHIVLEFTQGAVPDVHVRVTAVKWVPDNEVMYTLSIKDFYFSDDMRSFLVDGVFSSGTGTYKYGSKVTLTAKPRFGYEFDSWLNLTSIEEFNNPKLIVTVTNSTQWFAFYYKIPYVRGLADPADGGKVSGSGLCARGKKLTLKAAVNKNYTFVGWTTNNTARPESAPYPDGYFVATTPSLVIDRSAKPAANSKTSTTVTNVVEDVTYYAVFKSDPEIFVTVDATDGTGAEPTGKGAGKYVAGTITGMGKYAPGKKVTLKATANKGYVFAGWYETGNREEGIGNREEGIGNSSADGLLSQAVSYMIDKMPSNDVEYVAKFVTADEDKASIELAVNGEEMQLAGDGSPHQTNIWAGVYLEWPVAASALSEAKVKVAGLPAGLKFTDKPVTTKIGSGKTAVTVTNVPANTIYGAPTAASKTDKNTGAAKPSEVKVTVTTAGKSTQTYQIDATVDALPAWAQGTFAGGVYGVRGAPALPDDGHAGRVTLPGQVSLTVSAAGKVSGKALGDGLTYTLAAPYYTGFDMADGGSNFLADVTTSWSYKEGTKTIKTNDVVLLVVQDNGIGGIAVGGPRSVAADPDDGGQGDVAADTEVGPPEFVAWQYNWKVEPWKTLGKSFDKKTMTYAILPDGTFSEDQVALTAALGADVTARVTLKFAASGTVSVAGEFVTGYNDKTKKYTTVKATGSATLVPVDEEHCEVFIYLAPKGLAPHARSISVPWPEE